MAELSKRQKARLGAFVLTGAILLLGSLVVLAGLRLWDRRDRYSVRYADSVSGLEVSAPVKYQGLRVGRVEEMHIAADDPNLIEVSLSLDPGVRLYQGATARLDSNGLTGLKNINLSAGDPRAGILPPGSRLIAGSSAFDEIANKAAEIAVRLEGIATQLSRWTSDENRLRVERLLEGLDTFARSSDRFLTHTEKPIIDTLHAATKTGEATAILAMEGTRTLQTTRDEVTRTLEALRRPLTDVDPKEVALTVKKAHAVLNELEAGLHEAELGKSLRGLSSSMQRFDRLVLDLDLALTASRQDFTMSLAYLREATENLREFSRIVAQDPSVLLRGTEVAE